MPQRAKAWRPVEYQGGAGRLCRTARKRCDLSSAGTSAGRPSAAWRLPGAALRTCYEEKCRSRGCKEPGLQAAVSFQGQQSPVHCPTEERLTFLFRLLQIYDLFQCWTQFRHVQLVLVHLCRRFDAIAAAARVALLTIPPQRADGSLLLRQRLHTLTIRHKILQQLIAA